MPPPPTNNLRVVKYAQGWGHAATEWARALEAVDWSTPHADGGPLRLKVKANGDCPVWKATLPLPGGPREVVIKVEPLPSFRKRIQSMLRRTKSFRQWRGAELLEKKGFRAAKGLAILRAQNGPAPCDILVLEALPGKTILEHLAEGDLSVRQEHRLAEELGVWTKRLWLAGFHNRDHKPSNIVVVSINQAEFKLVDTVGIRWDDKYMQVCDPDREMDLEAMLAKLYLEPIGCGLAIRRPLWFRVFISAWPTAEDDSSKRVSLLRVIVLRNHSKHPPLNRVVDRIQSHGDPTPDDDPLARG